MLTYLIQIIGTSNLNSLPLSWTKRSSELPVANLWPRPSADVAIVDWLFAKDIAPVPFLLHRCNTSWVVLGYSTLQQNDQMILLPKSRLKMIFLFQRWDVLVPWRVPVARREKTVVSFFRRKGQNVMGFVFKAQTNPLTHLISRIISGRLREKILPLL